MVPLTLLHIERPKLPTILDFRSALGLNKICFFFRDMCITTRHKSSSVGTRLEFNHHGHISSRTPQARQVNIFVVDCNLSKSLAKLTLYRDYLVQHICADHQVFLHHVFLYLRGLSGGAMVLGKLPVPGRPTIWMIVGQGPIALAVGAGGGCLDIFTLIYPFSPLSPSLWETARYRLKYCLKGPLNAKQPTNQSYICNSPF